MMDTGGDFVKVHVSNSHNDMVAFEKKFAKFKTVEDFKVSQSIKPRMILCRLSGTKFILFRNNWKSQRVEIQVPWY